VNSGATVIVPRDPTPLNKWQGVGYISRQQLATGLAEAYIISGNLASESGMISQGASGTGDPNHPDTQTGNQPNSTNAGDPVNVANGNVVRDETDFLLPGIGLPLEFGRHYDSQSTTDIGLGVGWVQS